jgi:hypothetical protein
VAAFGSIFRGPRIEGVEGSDENGQRSRLVGLDLETGVVRVQAPRPGPAATRGAADAETDEAPDPSEG